MNCSFCGKPKIYAKGLCKNCYNRKWRKGTPDYTNNEEHKKEMKIKRKKLAHKYYLEHKEKIKDYNKTKWGEYYNNNKNREKERKAKWYRENKEQISKHQKEYREREKHETI